MEEIEYIRSNKGGQKIIYKGYMYTVHKNKKCGGIRWRCAQRSLNCKGSVSTTSLGIPYLNIPHNHLPDSHSTAIARSKVFDNNALDFHSFLDLLIQEQPAEQITSALDVSSEVSNVWEPLTEIEDEDSMPLELRLKAPTPSTTPVLPELAEPVLQSQPISPTKLKVTRQAKPSQPSPLSPVPSPAPPPPPIEEVCLKWNSHHSNMQSCFPSLLLKEQYVDATLVAEGQTLKCHRVILSSCSSYFEEVLASISPYQHPVLFMKDVPFWILKCLCDFMYAGEVHIIQTKLEELLKVAETLRIKGLAGQTAGAKKPEIKLEPPKMIKEEIIEDVIREESKKKEEKPLKKKEEKDLRKKEEKEIKKKEEKEIKKKEEKEIKKKEEKEIKKKEEKELKKKEELKPPEVKEPKRKDEKEIKRKEEKETREKKKVHIALSPEMPVLKSSKALKNPIYPAEMPVLKPPTVRAPKLPKGTGTSRRAEKKAVDKEKNVEKRSSKELNRNQEYLEPLLDLLEPTYEELAKDPKPMKAVIPKDPKNVTWKRSFQKKLKKRKLSNEREESPPPVFTRKGTRSRPSRKVPKFFHPPEDPSTIVREPHTDQADPLMHMQCIKSELLYDVDDSIEIEDNLVGFSESSVSVEEQLIGSYEQTPFGNYARVTRSSQKELQPIIMDVQSIANKKEEPPINIVSVQESQKLTDPLEDPLTLNQTSTHSPGIVEASDNPLGFRISQVITEKEDSGSAEACAAMGFQITNVISEQDGEDKSQKMAVKQELPEFYEPTLAENEDCSQSTGKHSHLMDTNEEVIVPVPPENEFEGTGSDNIYGEQTLMEKVVYNHDGESSRTETNAPIEVDTNFKGPRDILLSGSLQEDQQLGEDEELQPADCISQSPRNETSFEEDLGVDNAVLETEDINVQGDDYLNDPVGDADKLPYNTEGTGIDEDMESAPPLQENTLNMNSSIVAQAEDDIDMLEEELLRENNETMCNFDPKNCDEDVLNDDYISQASTRSKELHAKENSPHSSNSAIGSNISDQNYSEQGTAGPPVSQDIPDESLKVNDDCIAEENSSTPLAECSSKLPASAEEDNIATESNFSAVPPEDPNLNGDYVPKEVLSENSEEGTDAPSDETVLEESSVQDGTCLPFIPPETRPDSPPESSLNLEDEGKAIAENCVRQGPGSIELNPPDDDYDPEEDYVPEEKRLKIVDENYDEQGTILALPGSSKEDSVPGDEPKVNLDEDQLPADDLNHSNELLDENQSEDISNENDIEDHQRSPQVPEENIPEENRPQMMDVDCTEEGINTNENCVIEDNRLNPVDEDYAEEESDSVADNNEEYIPEENRPKELNEEETSTNAEREGEAAIENDIQQTNLSDANHDVRLDGSGLDVPDEEYLAGNSSSNVPETNNEEDGSLSVPTEDRSKESDFQRPSSSNVPETNNEEVDSLYVPNEDGSGESDFQAPSSSNVPETNNEEDGSLYVPNEDTSRESDFQAPSSSNVSLGNSVESYQSRVLPDPNRQTEEASCSNLPGFHIARVVSEQIAEIEGSRVPGGFADGSEASRGAGEKNYNELESIVNDLSRIVGDSCGEAGLGSGSTDDSISIADSLENLLQK